MTSTLDIATQNLILHSFTHIFLVAVPRAEGIQPDQGISYLSSVSKLDTCSAAVIFCLPGKAGRNEAIKNKRVAPAPRVS